MKENKDHPINPLNYEMRDGNTMIYPGLTKREYFAALAMQGFVSDSPLSPSILRNYPKNVASWSVLCADALLKELEK